MCCTASWTLAFDTGAAHDHARDPGCLDPAAFPIWARRMTTQALEVVAPIRAPVRANRQRHWRLHVLTRNPLVVVGLVLVVFFVSVAALAEVLAPADPIAMKTSSVLEPPSLAAPFGTDRFGRDVLSRAMFGARASLVVGVGSIAIAGTFGRVMDVFFTFPSLILAIAISAALGLGIQNAMLAIAITYWPVFGRLVRSTTLAERSKDYVVAARVVGASGLRIMRAHLLPNGLSPIV